MKRLRRADGQAMIEAALILPILLLVAVLIFEFGRAYQTWQILTNAAREGARIAVLPTPPPGGGAAVVARAYMQAGQLSNFASAQIIVNNNASLSVNGVAVPASQVTINYPFNFIVLRPVARLIQGNAGTLGNALVMQASATMRNEM